MTRDSAQTCHTVTLRDNSFSVQRVQMSSDGDTAVAAVQAAVVARSSGVSSHLCWCECWVSPLRCHYIVSRAPLSLHLSHCVTLSRCHAAPGHGDAVSRHCAPLRSPRHTASIPAQQPTFYCTPHMSHVHLYTSHVTCTHCTCVRV